MRAEHGGATRHRTTTTRPRPTATPDPGALDQAAPDQAAPDQAAPSRSGPPAPAGGERQGHGLTAAAVAAAAEGDLQAPAGRAGPPQGLVDAAGWAWRALVLVAVGWVLFEAAKRLYLVTLPFAAGVLLAALAQPVAGVLERRLPRWLAVLGTAVAFVVVIGGVGLYVGVRAVDQAPALVADASGALDRLPISDAQLASVRDQATSALSSQASGLTSTVVDGATTAGELAVGVVVAVFVAVYLLARGEVVWRWVVSLAPRPQRPALARTGPAMWEALGGWIRGTALIAVFHGVVVGLVLTVMGVPLAPALAMLVFLGSFIPVVGAFLFGGFAVLVTFATHGWVLALVLVGVLVVENQVEAHLLQPFLVGRAVHLNALAVIAALTAGSLLWGLAGGILAIPFTAAVHAAVKALREAREEREQQPATAPADRGPAG